MPARALNAADLPDDVDALKALVCRQIEREQHLEHELALVREKLNLALAKRFGRSSEQVPAAQLGLFNEAEQLAESADADTAPTCRAPPPHAG